MVSMKYEVHLYGNHALSVILVRYLHYLRFALHTQKMHPYFCVRLKYNPFGN